MRRRLTLASIAVLVISSANCTGNGARSAGELFSSNPLGPSAVTPSGGDATNSTQGKGGGGKGGGKGGSSATGTLGLAMVVDANGNGLPDWGDHVTFNVSSTAASPFVSVNCYQGATWVYSGSIGFFDAYPWSKEFTLAAGSWTGGAAACTARLYTSVDGSSSTTLATLPFNVGA